MNSAAFTISSGEELVYTTGAANIDDTKNGERYETVLLDTDVTGGLRWGNTELACLGDFVWHDLNANGQQEAGETGINGVPVTLQSLRDTVMKHLRRVARRADGRRWRRCPSACRGGGGAIRPNRPAAPRRGESR